MSKSFDRTSKVAHRRIERQMAQNTERINRLLKKYAKIETHPYDWVDHEKERSEALKEEAARQQEESKGRDGSGRGPAGHGRGR